jgi:hypothetical protein
MKSINELKSLNFKIDGLEIYDIYSEEEINNLSVDFYNRVLLQAYKIGLINDFNFWMPVVRNKTVNNGAMIVKHKGHNKSYQFNEYSGFNKVEGYEANEENFFYQLEIPSVEIDEFESMTTDIEVGKCLFFNSNLPHTSKINDSEEVSYSVIMRVYDYRKDLTLSDRTGIKSYQASGGGYPDIKPVTKI